MILRPYQSAMLQAVRLAWDEGHRRVLGCLPTGGGKTEVAIDLIRQEATLENRALVIVDRKNLAHQWAGRMQRHGIRDVGVLQGDNTKNVWAPILVGTAQTIKARGIPEGVGLIVIDESHIWHKTHDDVLVTLDGAKVLGLSATPLREGLGLRFDRMVVGATIRQLMDEGHLVRPYYLAPKFDQIDKALGAVEIRAGDFAGNQLSEAMRSKAIIGDVVGTWQKQACNRLTIAFCVDKAHAFDLAAEFHAAGVAAEAIVDETPDDERADIFARFEAGATRVLCSVGVLGIGFDSPIASCAILARPTLSLSLYVQQGGRVLRQAPGKDNALILDHAGNTIRHGLLEHFEPPADLNGVDKKADKKTRKDRAPVWVCKNCECVNDIADDICMGCGEPRRRLTTVVVVDGELVPIEHVPGAELPGPTRDDIRVGYQMLKHYAEAKGLKTGWAYYATIRRFKLPELRAKNLIDYDWRYLPGIPPDEEMSRWVRADYRRQKVISRYMESRHATA